MVQKKQISIIVNPISGVRKKADIPALVNQYLNKDLFDYELHFTQSASHTRELAKNAVEQKKDWVVAAGGDGTLNLVGSSLVHTGVPMGIIPLGSGNGFARALQIPMQPISAIQLLNTGKAESIDSGSANDIVFINVCGFGFDAHVTSKFAVAGKRGLQTYARIGIQEIASYKSECIQIKTREQMLEMESFILAICNGPQYGNNAYIAPKAKFHDGLFDITNIEKVSWRNILGLTKDLFLKSLHKSRSVKNFQWNEASIIRKNEGYVNIDGEPIWFEKDVKIKLFPKSLQIIVPNR